MKWNDYKKRVVTFPESIQNEFIEPVTGEICTIMGKREYLCDELLSIIDDTQRLEQFLIQNSNLPGPRSNLELAYAFADVCDDIAVLQEWIQITAEQADGNDPRSFLAFCAAVCLGKVYTKTHNLEILSILKQSANDSRWRMREAVAFAFQRIGENNFDELKKIFSVWLQESNNLEKRAILASLAHPPFLNEANAEFCFEIVDTVLREMNREDDFDVLKKGLCYTISVFTAANPQVGFSFIKRWIGRDSVIDRIMKENLKKKRLGSKFPQKVESLLHEL